MNTASTSRSMPVPNNASTMTVTLDESCFPSAVSKKLDERSEENERTSTPRFFSVCRDSCRFPPWSLPDQPARPFLWCFLQPKHERERPRGANNALRQIRLLAVISAPTKDCNRAFCDPLCPSLRSSQTSNAASAAPRPATSMRT